MVLTISITYITHITYGTYTAHESHTYEWGLPTYPVPLAVSFNDTTTITTTFTTSTKLFFFAFFVTAVLRFVPEP